MYCIFMEEKNKMYSRTLNSPIWGAYNKKAVWNNKKYATAKLDTPGKIEHCIEERKKKANPPPPKKHVLCY